MNTLSSWRNITDYGLLRVARCACLSRNDVVWLAMTWYGTQCRGAARNDVLSLRIAKKGSSVSLQGAKGRLSVIARSPKGDVAIYSANIAAILSLYKSLMRKRIISCLAESSTPTSNGFVIRLNFAMRSNILKPFFAEIRFAISVS